jgi:hypothetical protein
LKQILRQLSPTDAEHQTEGNAQLEGLFLSSLMLQIQKVNTFFIRRAQHLSEHVDRCAAPAVSLDADSRLRTRVARPMPPQLVRALLAHVHPLWSCSPLLFATNATSQRGTDSFHPPRHDCGQPFG